jgi:CubicO group peptidase (beta-lactamase class C family)
MKKYESILLIVVLTTLSVCNTIAQEKSSQLDSLFSYYNEYGSFSGVVLAAENGKMNYLKAFGFSDFEKKKVLDTSAVFNIASTTKPFTALAIMMLKEQKKLSYEDKLVKFLPDFPSYTKDITIKQLLTHTSGIKDYENELHLSRKIPVLTSKIVYDSLIHQKNLNFNPGEKYSYSNSGYFLLAQVIEKISGVSYKEFIEKNVFHPIGMSHSCVLEETTKAIPNRVNAFTGYWQKNEDDLNCKVPGDGNIYTTAMDLFRFEQSLYSDILIQQKSLKAAYDTSALKPAMKHVKYGFGWMIESDNAGSIVFHPGGLGGFRCFLWRNLDTRSTLIILSNNTFLADCRNMLSSAQKIMKGQPYTLGKIPITELFYEKYSVRGFNTALKAICEEKKKQNSIYIFPELLINNLGLEYLFFKNEPYSAVELFKLNVELYPKSWNTWDSLGEAYLSISDNKSAIAAFEKSLKLNPKNNNAEERLNKLKSKK